MYCAIINIATIGFNQKTVVITQHLQSLRDAWWVSFIVRAPATRVNTLALKAGQSIVFLLIESGLRNFPQMENHLLYTQPEQ
jgi:hypothetical protein